MGTRDISTDYARPTKPLVEGVEIPPTFHINSLSSALERYDDTFRTLFSGLEILEHKQESSVKDIQNIYLRAIEKISRCCVASLYDGHKLIATVGNSQQVSQFPRRFKQALQHEPEAFAAAPEARLLSRESSTTLELAILPMRGDKSSRGVILQTTQEEGVEVDEVIYFSLKRIYSLSDEFTKAIPLNELKASVYDLLKQRYQYVSEFVYDERFALFKESLQNVKMHFEPIFSFDNVHQSDHYYSWEALARVGDATQAPVNILQAAELWGTHFKTELDIYILEKSIVGYCKEAEKAGISQHEIRPLSINIYPETLFRPAYHDKLEELLSIQKLIRGQNVILEVSEKSIIDDSNNNGKTDTVQSFLTHMDALRKEYGIAFAIDDFGTGHSSIIRLDTLKPEWVKIDRQMLHCDPKFAKRLIESLLTMKTNWEGPAFKIIIEGLDGDSKIGLNELVNDLNVEYIQGYLLGKAQAHISKTPDTALSEKIHSCAGWEAKALN